MLCCVAKTFQSSEIKKIRNRTQNVLMEIFDVFLLSLEWRVQLVLVVKTQIMTLLYTKLSQSASFVGEIDLRSESWKPFVDLVLRNRISLHFQFDSDPLSMPLCLCVCLFLFVCLHLCLSVCLSVYMDGDWSESADTENNCNLQTIACS